MIDINGGLLQKSEKGVSIPYYSGKCVTCKHKQETQPCKKENFLVFKRKFHTFIGNDKVCDNWEIHISYLTKLTPKRYYNGKQKSKNGAV